jgi:hypothetical protein
MRDGFVKDHLPPNRYAGSAEFFQVLVNFLSRFTQLKVAGQIFRIFRAVTKTIFGQIPSGNTGGSNVSPFKRTPISPELQLIINAARAKL